MKFYGNSFDSLREEVQLREQELAILVVNSICNFVLSGRYLKEDKLDLDIEFHRALPLKVEVSSRRLIYALERNFKLVEQAEEYELCSKALKCINILREGDNINN